jgi:hypothetical protein
MVQATDGNWYGYFADRAQAQKADSTQAAGGVGFNGTGVDFGVFCTAAGANTVTGVSFTQTVGVAIARQTTNNDGSQGENTLGSCTGNAQSSLHNNVVRENKTLNRGGSSVPVGQIGVSQQGIHFWPFIQLYNFNPTGNVVIQYNKGGGVQSTTLKFDTVDQFAKLDLDRTTYPRGAQVQATITDLQLNIDPTDEDSWTFGTTTSNATTYYGVFNEDGSLTASNKVSKALTGNLTGLMFEDNGVLKLNVAAQGSTVV